MQKTLVNPYEKKTVAQLNVANPRAGWALKCKYSWLEGDPDPSMVEAMVSRDNANISRMLDAARELDFGADSATIGDINAKCDELDVNFVDIEFPPNEDAIAPEGSEARGKEPITWRRPVDFFDGAYEVFVGAVEPNDIRQGSLGDCWLLCAMSALAERPGEIQKMFVMDDGSGAVQTRNEHGVYKVRLCKNGEWQFVRLDDYFPCFPEAGPVYSKSHGNELWVLLLEKAFAKLHGSYDALRGGWAYEALMDMTGAPCSSVRLEDESVQADVRSGKFWRDLQQWDELGYLLTASTPGEDKFTETGNTPAGGPGLVAGHAYSLIQARTTSRGQKLLQLRNPWGSFEWNGDWSDESPLWTDALRAELGVAAEAVDDGAFWMSYEDFLKFFRSVNVCRLPKPGYPWQESRRKGRFTFEPATGKLTASTYILSVPERTTAFLMVHQEDERIQLSEKYLDVGLTLLREREDGTYDLVGGTGIEVSREVLLEVELEAGEYFVVPNTTGCKFSLTHGAKDVPAAPENIWDASRGAFTPEAEDSLREIHRRLDEDMDGLLKREELNSFQQMSEGCDMVDEVYAWLIENFDSRDGGLTADGFVECYQYMFEASGNDQSVVWRDLHYMGYNNALDLSGARTFVLSVHAECRVGLWKVPFDPMAFEEALETPVKALGEVQDFANGALRVYKKKNGYWGVTLAVENLNGESAVTVTMDCSESSNVVSHTGSLVAEVTVPSGETKIVHHLMPEDLAAWSYSFKAGWRFHG